MVLSALLMQLMLMQQTYTVRKRVAQYGLHKMIFQSATAKQRKPSHSNKCIAIIMDMKTVVSKNSLIEYEITVEITISKKLFFCKKICSIPHSPRLNTE